MTFLIRPAREDDLQALYEMAKLTGGGFTNLPPEKPALRTKLERSALAFSRTDDALKDELFVLVLENSETREVREKASALRSSLVCRAGFSGGRLVNPPPVSLAISYSA